MPCLSGWTNTQKRETNDDVKLENETKNDAGGGLSEIRGRFLISHCGFFFMPSRKFCLPKWYDFWIHNGWPLMSFGLSQPSCRTTVGKIFCLLAFDVYLHITSPLERYPLEAIPESFWPNHCNQREIFLCYLTVFCPAPFRETFFPLSYWISYDLWNWILFTDNFPVLGSRSCLLNYFKNARRHT